MHPTRAILILVFSLLPLGAQEPPVTTFRVNVVAKSTKALNYRHRSGSTMIDFRGTAAASRTAGKARVESKQGRIEIEANFSNFPPAHSLGPEYLTYVLWAITPEGRPQNLGEILLNNGTKSKITVTTELQVFGLIVTAEPYYAVTMPSSVIVAENEIRPDTLGKWEILDAKYELLQPGQYAGTGSAQPPTWSPKIPIELIEARNAVRIARLFAADRYANDVYLKAAQALAQAEDYHDRRAGDKPVSMMSREAVQRSEDARILSLARQDDERLAQERKEAADREAKARAEEARARADADAETRRRQQAEADRAAAERSRQEADLAANRAASERAAADRARLEAERARGEAEAARQQAEAAKAAALAQQQQLSVEADKARQYAVEADRLRQKAEQEKADLRQQIRDQLNMILETRDSARGLIVNMSDVLFETGRYTLRQDARERLARVSGIVLAHPTLRLEIEGHTDSVGGDAYNQKLSEQRASAVRDFLSSQGLHSDRMSAIGFGKTKPIAPNENAAGRQKNRRVEIVVSGDEIGPSKSSL